MKKRTTVDRLSAIKAEIDNWAMRELPRMDDREAAGCRTALAVIDDLLREQIHEVTEIETAQKSQGLHY
jgi:hypothetical protein